MTSGLATHVIASNATYVCGTVDRIFLVRWVGDVTRPAMREVFDHMLTARRSIGSQLVTVSVVPANVSGPPRTSDASVERHFEVVDRVSDAIYAVFEGEGIARKILRGFIALSGLTMKSTIVPCASVDEALGLAARQIHRSVEEVIAGARSSGLIG